MAILITVEDGTIVTDANSFITVAEARQYALNRGIVLSAVDDEVAAQIIKATDYLESFALRYQGTKVDVNQSLQWPRNDVYLYGNENVFPFNSIPKELKFAQFGVVLAINSGIDVMPNYSASDYVTKEKVGPIETEYANPFSIGIVPTLTQVESLLAPLFGNNDFAIKTIRV